MKRAELTLRREEFPDLSTGEATDRLIRALNRFGTEVSSALSNGLTFSANFNAFEKEINFVAPLTTQRFPNQLSAKPRFVLLGDARDVTGGADLAVSAGNPAWTVSGKDIVISAVTGLTSGHKYRCRILIIGS